MKDERLHMTHLLAENRYWQAALLIILDFYLIYSKFSIILNQLGAPQFSKCFVSGK